MSGSSGSGKFFANHRGNNLGGGLVKGFSLRTDILSRYLVKRSKQIALAGEKAARSLFQGRGGFSPEFVKSVRFFFSHSRHVSLLEVGEGAPDFPALHRVEYVDSLFVNDIVHHLKQSAAGIKAEKQVFVFALVNLLFKNEVPDGVANIRFTDTMLEGSLIKLNIIFKHLFTIIQSLQNGKSPAGTF
jgi:hypothetical protein